jgi:uracil-DNA glycosylase
MSLAEDLIATLPHGQANLFNPYRDRCPCETEPDAPAARRARLAAHLALQPDFLLIGEAVGYQGGRYSGIAFTSERLLLAGAIPRLSPPPGRLTTRGNPFSEPSATIVWGTLQRLGMAERTALWNAVQLHPHHPDEPWSNRTPSDDELALGRPALEILRRAYPRAQFVAVGNKAAQALAAMGLNVPAVRHPANGGANKFAEGIHNLALP